MEGYYNANYEKTKEFFDSLNDRDERLARSIVLKGESEGDEFGWYFDDNFFDLLPGEKKVVRILGKHKRGSITAKPFHSPYCTEIKWG